MIISVKLFWNWATGLGGDIIKIFFYFQLWRPFYSAEGNHFSNFGRESSKEHFCGIALKPGHWPTCGRTYRLKFFFFFFFFSISNSGGHFFFPAATILAILVEGHARNISMIFFLKSDNWPRRRCRLKVLLLLIFLALAAILFSASKAEPKKFSLKLFWNRAVGLGRDVV